MRDERGIVTLLVVGLGLTLVVSLALVGEAGKALAEKAHLAAVAEQAALAGTDTAAPGPAGGVTLVPAAATAAADKVLSADGVMGSVVVTGLSVQVGTVANLATPLLALVGTPQLKLHVSSSATATKGS